MAIEAQGRQRQLVGLPTPDIVLQRPYMLQEQKGRLCPNTPMLLVLSLLADQIRLEVNADPMKLVNRMGPQWNLDLPSDTMIAGHSTQTLHDIPVFEPFPDHHSYVTTVPSVLVKTEFGRPAGVVLQGDLTGVILYIRKSGEFAFEMNEDYPVHEGMSLNRLWNDEELQDTRSYLFFFGNFFGDISEEFCSQFKMHLIGEGAALRGALLDMMQEKIDELVRIIKGKTTDGKIWISDLFIQACKQYGITLDDRRFLRTRIR